MRIIAFNGSPRKNGNTSSTIKAILEGAASVGAETTEVMLHHIDMKGCMGCLNHIEPAAQNIELLEEARAIGRRLLGK